MREVEKQFYQDLAEKIEEVEQNTRWRQLSTELQNHPRWEYLAGVRLYDLKFGLVWRVYHHYANEALGKGSHIVCESQYLAPESLWLNKRENAGERLVIDFDDPATHGVLQHMRRASYPTPSPNVPTGVDLADMLLDFWKAQT